MKVKGKVSMLLLVFLVAITANLLAGGQQGEAEVEEPDRMHITWLPHNPKGYINEENSPTEIYVEDKTEKQFEIEDNRDVDKIVGIIKQKGYYPVFKDWESQFKGVKVESSY